ncbi:MAG: hypothetical protein IPP15_00655 [Saprospiraceae bacterium]|uniref:Gliding motility-associated C-terminal domain-containing protein n=1 Tax=Candidatus Opimibacter skivensis TaxID=2982028 RepID=A0A9D7STX2_9BACT|nr:hypothetical protein [Candidatus Opimibacter skivensis]
MLLVSRMLHSGNGYAGFYVKAYFGDLVFSSYEIPFTWDGKFGNEKVMPGVYVYKIQLKYMFNGKETSELFVGDVTVIR